MKDKPMITKQNVINFKVEGVDLIVQVDLFIDELTLIDNLAKPNQEDTTLKAINTILETLGAIEEIICYDEHRPEDNWIQSLENNVTEHLYYLIEKFPLYAEIFNVNTLETHSIN